MKKNFLSAVLIFCCMSSAFAADAFRYSEAKNQFLSVGPIRYAYRKLGKEIGVPLIILMHTRGNMDSWDPAFVDTLANERVVIAFDNKGVGLTNGKAPQSFEEMADDAASFIDGLGYKNVDVLGFSIGGAIGQELIIRHPQLVRKAILAGTSAKGGEGLNAMPDQAKSISTKGKTTEEDFLFNFFAPSTTSVALGREFLARLKTRKVDLDSPVSMETTRAQAVAREAWGNSQVGYEELLKKISIPVLIANGKEDIRMPVVNSYKLFLNLPHAQLALFSDAGHGFLFQLPVLVAQQFNVFLAQQKSF